MDCKHSCEISLLENTKTTVCSLTSQVSVSRYGSCKNYTAARYTTNTLNS